MKMRALLLFAVLSQPVPSFAQNLVVWDFATRDGKKTELAASLTHEFEEALSESRAYVVLERRNFDRLQAVIENEKALQSISQITPAVSREVKQMGVSVVVFGEVFDDVRSGEISVAVTFQDFTGEKLLVKSVLMRRGLALDAASRREKMRDLVRAISGPAVKPPSTTEAQAPRPAAPEPIRVRVKDHVFELKRCARSGESLQCEILITNEGADRKVSLFASNARLIDEGGTEYQAISLTFVGSSRRTMVFGNNKPPSATDLATGVPVKAVVTFEGIPSSTQRAALIEIRETAGGFYGGRGLNAQFRNVPLPVP